MRNDGARKFRRPNERTLEVDVGIDERWRDKQSRRVDPNGCLDVDSDAGNVTIHDRNVGADQLTAKDIDDGTASDDHVGRLDPMRNAQPAAPEFHIETGV